MPINSRAKGARGEREVRDVLREHGFTARRGQQFAGGGESPDVICTDLPWLHIESKLVENLNISKAMAQSRRDASGKVPTVWHRKSNETWLVTLSAEDFMELVIMAHDLKQKKNGSSKHTETTTPGGCLTTDAPITVANSACGAPDGNPSDQGVGN